MPLPRRSGSSLAVTALVLALAACGSGGSTTPGGTSPSSSGAETGPAASATTSSPRTSASSSSSTNEPDPTVSVTSAKDSHQSAAARTAGLGAADARSPASSLSIPAVGLSTSLEAQGLRGGKVNPAPGQVIWFTGYDRVRPGAAGTSVIAGHVISGGQPDSFAALEQLTKGDGVLLSYPGGATLRFEVTSTDIVDKDELTTSAQVWGANTDTRRVVLVTCDDQLGFRTDGHRKANFVAVAELPS